MDMSLSETSKAKRIEKALEVLALLTTNPKMTQKQACEKVDIEPDTYRYWISQSHEAIAAFREAVQQVERIELVHILVAKEQILQKLIGDGLARYTDPIARLAIMTYLDNRLDILAERHRSTDTTEVKDFLNGPKLSPGSNRFGSMEVKEQSDGSINIKAKPPMIIDAQLLEKRATEQQMPSSNYESGDGSQSIPSGQ